MNDGYSSGDVIKAVEEVAQQTLPVGYGYEYGGITREEAGSGSNTIIVFAHLHRIRLPHPLRPLRKPVHSFGGYVE